MKALALALLILVNLLACATPAAAENFYEYGLHVLVSPPLTVTGPGHALWDVRVPVWARVGQVYVKNCRIQGLDSPVTFDEQITLYQMGADFPRGGYRFLIGDRTDGRTQTYCLRLPYTPLPEE